MSEVQAAILLRVSPSLVQNKPLELLVDVVVPKTCAATEGGVSSLRKKFILSKRGRGL